MAQYEDLQFDQGADQTIELQLVNVDGSKKNLGGYTIAAKMKKSYTSDSNDTLAFTPLIASPVTDGIATLTLTNTQTDALKPGRYVYDVELSFVDSDDNTVIERILEGRITVTPSVTK